ncbi:MAG TPA: putative LPS assembly protein LptD [Vicinamibacterales bacterium]|nr:putative LPS assembly protein LptD [Vicinamibacterales bacterium]
MINFSRGTLAAVALILVTPQFAAAQLTDIPGFNKVLAQVQRLDGNRFLLTEGVELEQESMRFYADQVEYHADTKRMIATGNVLLIETDHQIAADRADFNAETRLGTFFNARGFATIGALPGAAPDASAAANPDVQFYGETLEKTGIDTYVITNGGFTSCVQANPRWEMTSGSLKLRVDHYALLRNMFLKVKGVPAIYLPVMYYPLSKENRNTGFLMPSYGSSSYKGQTISNAFFWAINRSQDATFLHDWFSKTGQAIAGEYRYVSLGGSGNIRTDFLNEKAITFTDLDGRETEQPGRRTFRTYGNLSQSLGGSWYAQGQADYSSDLTVDRLYDSDIARATRTNRSYGGSVSGTAKGLRVTGTYNRNEYFAENGTSSLRGTAPRINVARPDRLLPGLPVYASVTSEYVRIEQKTYKTDRTLDANEGLDRIDIAPAIRFPFNKLAFLALNTTATFRNTFWTDSMLVDVVDGAQRETRTRLHAPISRRFVELSADVNGPTLVRIWDAPNSKYAQRFRHSIEPFAQVLYRTAIDNYLAIPKIESADNIVGNATSYSYGLNTRFYAKRTVDGPRAIPREVISATIRQTYYSDARSILSDSEARSRNIEPTSHFSPVSMIVRTSPFDGITGNFRTVYDGRYSRFRSFSSDAGWEEERLSLQAGWSNVRFNPNSRGVNIARQSHYFNAYTNLRLQDNRYGITHAINWDVKNQALTQHRIASYYNAQCCGFSAEYQFIDLTGIARLSGVQQDSRFHFSVTLGGIGNVSNIFGAMGGTNQR